ncbi:hypothetical protein AVEN_12996-1 [Araneus ventricosus]|uniref:Uncharacterized protein n=1 Tax=Araneus ventricosus TaxID=182803 RepID=A0A4Y2SEE7_ARAVE|nr:hypothetical protein AVEN_12996-1 [Araneus ventricosus]
MYRIAVRQYPILYGTDAGNHSCLPSERKMEYPYAQYSIQTLHLVLTSKSCMDLVISAEKVFKRKMFKSLDSEIIRIPQNNYCTARSNHRIGIHAINWLQKSHCAPILLV